MADDDSQPRTNTNLRTARMEAFSDGVYAIAITLLVLELTVPAASEQHLLAELADQWPEYLAYLVSFATIGGAWIAHSEITEYLSRAVAATIYGVNLLAIAALTSVLWHYAVGEKLVHPSRGDEELRTLTKKFTPSMAFYAAGIALGLLLPRAAVAFYLVIALYFMLPFRTILRHLRHQPDPD